MSRSDNSFAAPPSLQRLGIPENAGLAWRAARYIFGIDGQKIYDFKQVWTKKRGAKQREFVACDPQSPSRVHGDVKADQSLYLGFLGAGGVEQFGRPGKIKRACTYEEIAGAAGWKASSTVWRNLRQAKLVAADKQRKFGGAVRYRHNVPVSAPPDGFDRDDYWVTPEKLNSSEQSPVKWRPKRENEDYGYGGYFYIQAWVLHPKSPVSPAARKVMAYLNSQGFLNEEGRAPGEQKNGKKKDIVRWIQRPLATIADAVSMTPETVREAIREWEELSVFKVVKANPDKLPDKEGFKNEALYIEYLPELRVTKKIATIERKRLAAAALRLALEAGAALGLLKDDGKPRRDWWHSSGVKTYLERILFEAESNGWLLTSFWLQCRQRMGGRRVDPRIIERLIPRPPD